MNIDYDLGMSPDACKVSPVRLSSEVRSWLNAFHAYQRIAYSFWRDNFLFGEAARLKKPNAVRAIARANGLNRIAIVIPCHRVIGSDGDLKGYGGGLARKKWLIAFEKGEYPSRAPADP